MNQLQELRTLYAKVRAGHDPDTKQLHITEEEFVYQLLELFNEREIAIAFKDAEVVTHLLSKYADTPINERGNGWDWLVKAQDGMRDLRAELLANKDKEGSEQDGK